MLRKALAGVLFFGAPILIHAQTDIPVAAGTTVTTGIVGVNGATQTARLNVLNLQPVIPGVAAVACPVTLAFYDDTGALLKQLVLTNINPATAASLDVKPSGSGRAKIRASVFTPANGIANTGSDTPPAIPLTAGCNVMASLEIIDDATGETRVFTTDLRFVTGFRLLPVLASGL